MIPVILFLDATFLSLKPCLLYHAGVSLVFSRKATGFHGCAKLFELNFFRGKLHDVSLDYQTKRAKSSSQLVNLPIARPLKKPLPCKYITQNMSTKKKPNRNRDQC